MLVVDENAAITGIDIGPGRVRANKKVTEPVQEKFVTKDHSQQPDKVSHNDYHYTTSSDPVRYGEVHLFLRRRRRTALVAIE